MAAEGGHAGLLVHHHLQKHGGSKVLTSGEDLLISGLGITSTIIFAGAVNEFTEKAWPEHGWHRMWSEMLAAFLLVLAMWAITQQRNKRLAAEAAALAAAHQAADPKLTAAIQQQAATTGVRLRAAAVTPPSWS